MSKPLPYRWLLILVLLAGCGTNKHKTYDTVYFDWVSKEGRENLKKQGFREVAPDEFYTPGRMTFRRERKK